MIPLRDSHPSKTFPVQTVLLILANLYVFYLQVTATNPDSFIFTFGLVPTAINLTQPDTWWPFVSAMFLHGGLLHLASNMLFLWVFGDNVEDTFNWLFLPFYLAGGVIANAVQYAFMSDVAIPIIGASGAVAAVMGAYIVLFPHARVHTLVFILFFLTIVDIPAVLMLGYWFALQLLNGYTAINETSYLSGGVAYFAHIAGFVFGLGGGMLAKLTFPNRHTS